MTTTPSPSNEARRLEVLRLYKVLDSDSDQVLDDLTLLAAQICETPIAVISLVDEHRQWFAAKVGIATTETPRDISFCRHALEQDGLLVVPDATQDPRFAQNPTVTGEPGIRFYAGAPLVSPEGSTLGTLCVIDRVPRALTPPQEKALEALARQVMVQFELRRRACELAEAEGLLRAIYETDPDCVMLLGQDCAVQMVNRSGLAMMEADDPEEVSGRRFSEFIVPLHRGRFEKAMECVLGGCSDKLEFPVIGLKGRERWWETHATPMRDKRGDGTKLLIIARDITERKRAEIATNRLVAIIESSDDAILGQDLEGKITSWNPGAEALFGYRADEILGKANENLIPEERRDEEAMIQERVRRGENVRHLDTVRKTKSGAMPNVSISASPIKDASGEIVGISKIARDITVAKEHEREIIRLSQLYVSLSQINQAIVRMPSRDELFTEVCRVLVEHGKFDMAWVGWRDAETHRLMPVAVAGDTYGYLQTVEIHYDDRPTGHGPAGKACREGRSYICNDITEDPSMLPWKAEALKCRWRAIAAFPIRVLDEVCGSLVVYANEPGYFRDQEVALLEEAAVDVSFALENYLREAARRQAEDLARNEKLFSDTMIQSMPGVLYFYDENWRFIRWNRNVETVSGYTAEEIAEMTPLDFFAVEDQVRLRAKVEEVFERGESSLEALFLAKDGTKTPYFFTGRKVIFQGKTCLVGMGIDISERKRAEEQLAESERKYRELVQHANSIILRWDSEGRVTLLNEFGQRFFGYTEEEILGRNVVGTIVPGTETSGRDLTRLMEQIRADPKSFEQNINENVRRDGRRAWVSWTNRVERDDHGRVLEILSIGTDITEQREAEQAIREMNIHLEQRVTERTAELQTALVRAEAADRLKSAFLATMSHELRTPLNSIIGFTSTVLQGLAGPLNAEQNKQLGMVRTSARHLLELINDVLDLSKIEAGQLKVRCEPLDVAASVSRVTGLVQPLVEKKKLQLDVRMSPDIGEITSDRRRVEQILLNLLNNAIKFTERGSVILTVTVDGAIAVEPGKTAGPAMCFSVADTGIGIRPEHIGSLFQPFRQLDSGISRVHEGTGLGLAICRRLAALLGGRISAKSEWQKGSEFTVIIPLKKSPEP